VGPGKRALPPGDRVHTGVELTGEVPQFEVRAYGPIDVGIMG
jgi:hypothetical protein